MDTVLYVPYFKTASTVRQAELDLCIKKNLEVKQITKIYLIIDDGSKPPVNHKKLEIINVSSRPTYQHWVEYSYKNNPNSISLLANADIYFGEGFEHLVRHLSAPLTFLALTRYDLKEQKLVPHANPKWSQDVWGINTASPLNRELYKELDFMLGVPRCDNKVAYVFSVYGWKVVNPMQSVVSVHVHESEERTYSKKTDVRILGGVAYVDVLGEGAESSVLEYDVYARRESKVAHVALSKVIDKLTPDEWKVHQPYINLKEFDPNSRGPSANAAPQSTVEASFDVASLLQQLNEGPCQVDIDSRFSVVRRDNTVQFVDSLYLNTCEVDASTLKGISLAQFEQLVLQQLIPTVFDTWPITFTENGVADDQLSFWQYPCTTELQALRNHLSPAKPLQRLDAKAKTLHLYFGVPWATFIDRKAYPEYLADIFAVRVRGFHRLAQLFGYSLKVHSVCQTIHWQKMIPTIESCGVTDLHISHMETHSQSSLAGVSAIKLHPWSLIATNIEVPGRDVGITYGKPIAEKKWFATFIGAHMKHYRSDVRLKLKEAADAAAREDVLVNVKGEWHFNKIVYKEQVALKALSTEEKKTEQEATESYNRMLSDSIFSLCPEGAGPNTLRFWESLAVGSIPVVIADTWVPPDEVSTDDRDTCVVRVKNADLPNLFVKLSSLKVAELGRMSQAAMRTYNKVKDKICF